ncbi:MAG TPA: DUF6569 family protein [Acidobacteriota bacterium]
MKRQIVSKATGFAFALIGSISIALLSGAVSGQTKGASQAYKLSGPYAHENLTIFLIHGKDRLTNRRLITLSEALAQKKVRVHETGRVNELIVENLSDDDVFIHSGDIVKGGKQDRTFPDDCLLPARSGQVSLPAFCVEQGRWQRRGSESAAYFDSSYAQLPSKELKLAARHEQAQDKVWRAASGVVGGVSEGVGLPVASPISSTSLELSLENGNLKQAVNRYLQKLLPLAEYGDTVGYAFFINGELNSADIYASQPLFRKLWPILLEASAIEAISKRAKGFSTRPASAQSVKLLLADFTAGKTSTKEIGPATLLVKEETDRRLLFESRDRKDKDIWIHRSYLTK